MPGWGRPHDIGKAHVRGTSKHDTLGLEASHADCNDAQGIDHGCVAVGAHEGIGEGHTVEALDDRRHPLEIDLMEDAIARRNDIDILEGLPGPVDKVEPILVSSVFNGPVLLEGLGIKAPTFDCQGVVHHQLGGHHRIDLGGIATPGSNGIAQAREVDQGGLAEDVMTDNAGGVPGKVKVLSALDELAKGIDEHARITSSDQVFSQDLRGVGQAGIGPWGDLFNGLTGIEVIEPCLKEWSAMGAVHASNDGPLGPQTSDHLGPHSWRSGG
jgi:hypothetical protein